MTEATITAGEDALTSERIWREFGIQLQAFVRRRIADPHEADDVVGTILVRIHRGLHEVNDKDRVTAWVFRIARNAIIDSHRRKARSREQLEATLDDLGPQRADGGDDAEPSSALRELAACMRPLLGGLSAEQRRAVQLTDLDGLTQAQAAALEGVSVSGVKSRVQRGRHRLAQLLGECCVLTLDGRGLPMDYTPPADCACP